MKKILFTSLILSHLILLGCSDELKKDSDSQPTVNKELRSLDRNLISYSLTPTAEPNKYQVTFSWGKTSDVVEVSASGQRKTSTQKSTEGFSEILDGGKTYEYSLSIFDSNRKFKDQLAYFIDVPRDYVLSGEVEFKGDTVLAANRIFIKQNALVTTYRNRLTIEANEIFAEGGTIQNYPWGYQDCVEFAGYPGGNITITAKKAQGNLSIISLGARGCMFQGPGGAGGNLNVQIDEGKSLFIDLQLKRALGSPARPGMGWADGALGSPGVACISLTKETKNECEK